MFIDGQFVPALSVTDGNAIVSTLAAGIDRHGDVIQRHLARHAAFGDDAFCAINTAHLTDGALVVAPRNAAVAAPVQLIFVTTQADLLRCIRVA